MITEGTSPPISIDLGSNEPGMTLQREYREGDKLVWRDVLKDGQAVKSPVDIDALPSGKYRLFDNWKEERLKSIESSQEFFGNQNKLEREKYVVSRLLEQFIPGFQESDLRQGEEPADVQFRDANFQVKEIVPDGRRRGDEFKAAKSRIKAAKEYTETLETYTPEDLTLGENVADCDEFAQRLRDKYGVRERGNLDLIFYHNNNHGWEQSSEYEAIVNHDFRSLSVVSNRFRLVVYAENDAPNFLQSEIGNVREIARDDY